MKEAIAHNPDIQNQVTPEEWIIRQDLAAAYRIVAYYGWDDMIFTHLSARVPGPEDHFLINPFGFLFNEVTASNLVKIDKDANVVLDNGYEVNPAGFTIHSAIHMAREDAQAVMHLHTESGVTVSSTKSGFLPLNQHALFVYHDLAYHDFEGIAVNLEERERLVADLGSKNLIMLRNHGTLALGSSIANCFTRLYFLEKACKFQVGARASGELHMPSQQSMAFMQELFIKPETWEWLAASVWPAMRRQADRLDPNYAS